MGAHPRDNEQAECRAMDYEEAMKVLRSWSGKWVTIVAFVEPGVSLRPLAGFLTCEDGAHHILRATIHPSGARVAFPIGTFHDASWVPGQEGHGLSIEQGATRVDVFLEDEA
jgi:hypothetical protein